MARSDKRGEGGARRGGLAGWLAGLTARKSDPTLSRGRRRAGRGAQAEAQRGGQSWLGAVARQSEKVVFACARDRVVRAG